MLRDHPAVLRRLDDELVGWLTTVSPEGQPQASAVWFLRDGDGIVVFSGSSTRMRNLAANPRVAFNLRGDPRGESVVTLEGVAAVVTDGPLPRDHPVYLDKYGGEIARLGWTPESFSEDYPVMIRIAVQRVRAWGES